MSFSEKLLDCLDAKYANELFDEKYPDKINDWKFKFDYLKKHFCFSMAERSTSATDEELAKEDFFFTMQYLISENRRREVEKGEIF